MSDKTVREAMVTVALEEIDSLTSRLEEVAQSVQDIGEVIPAYFEEASNETANIVRRGVEAEIQICQKRLSETYKQVIDSIEIQRRLNNQLKSLAENMETNGSNQLKQALIPAVGAFFGALIAVLLGSLF
ncbi:Uncharacterised protein [Moraxella caprae]|uniref:Uncharacterized protein n=1 Tax=Moraxella caprae TaxID=90240 RepID=A0A378QL00_9GAMM|nr:hypothetical protein [Moraxella caprae]STZ01577.1 Uncharacterised protein [Moraxella caprae]